MSKRKPSNGLIVTDLTRAYTEYKTVLVRRAARKVQNHVIAEEIVQDAFLKLMLAAPELKSQDHLLAYLNKSIDNLAINHGTKLSNRADLIAIDSEATQAEVDVLLATNVNDELSADLIRAEDASIVREAISRMTPADRDILLLSEFEGLSAEAIAAQFGMSTSTVRSSLTRARHSLRKILEEWIVDEETGMTAAQYLSRTGKKIAENSKKIGSAALSLVLLVAAFFGFWNNPSTLTPIAAPTTKSTPTTVAAPATGDDDETESLIAQLQSQIAALSGIASTLGSIELSLPKFNIPGPTPLFAKAGAFDVLENDYAVTGEASALGEVSVICSINPDGTFNARFFAVTDKGLLVINQNFAIDATTINASFEINGVSNDLHVVAVQSKLTESGLTQLDFTIVADRDVLTDIAKPQGFGITIVLNSTLSAVTGQNVSIATVPALMTPLTNSARLALPGATP